MDVLRKVTEIKKTDIGAKRRKLINNVKKVRLGRSRPDIYWLLKHADVEQNIINSRCKCCKANSAEVEKD